MFKNNLFLVCLMVLLFSGCTVTVNKTAQEGIVPQALAPVKPLINLDEISVGNSIDQVKEKIGDEVIIGYTIKQEGQTVPITQKSLQKEEKLKAKGFTYQVLYYFTYIVHPDDQVTENETTPLVFENGILISKTWDEFNKIKSNQ